MRWKKTTWKQTLFYGEIFGFLLAWIAGIAVAMQPTSYEPHLATVDHLASMSNLRGSDLRGTDLE